MLAFRSDPVRWYAWFSPLAKRVKQNMPSPQQQNIPATNGKIQNQSTDLQEATATRSRCWVCLLLETITACLLCEHLSKQGLIYSTSATWEVHSVSSTAAQHLTTERWREGKSLWLPSSGTCQGPTLQGWQPSAGLTRQWKPGKAITRSLAPSKHRLEACEDPQNTLQTFGILSF